MGSPNGMYTFLQTAVVVNLALANTVGSISVVPPPGLVTFRLYSPAAGSM